MFTKTILTAIAATFAFAAAPSSASAGKGHRFDVCQAVACTDAQAQQIRTLRDAKKDAVKPIREQSKAVRAELHAEKSKEQPDTARVEALRAELHDLRAKTKAHFKSYMTNVKAVLTPEQVAKLEQMKSERKKNYKGKGKAKGKAKGKGRA
jgi:Spy/CpxP family protein refolding chaperone